MRVHGEKYVFIILKTLDNYSLMCYNCLVKTN